MARNTLPAVSTPAEPNEEGTKLSRAEQAKLAEWQTQAAAVLADMGMSVEYGFVAFFELAKTKTIEATQSNATLGAALLAIRAHEPAQRFRWVLDQCGIGEGSAYALMALARHVAKSGAHRKVHEALGPSKAMAVFRHFDEAEIEALAYAEDKLDELSGKSVRQLADELRRAKEDAATIAASKDKIIARKDAKLNELQEQIDRKAGHDAEQARANELLGEYDATSSEIFRALVALENITSSLYELRQKTGFVFTSAINEKLLGNVGLLAKRVAKLQHFGGEK